MAISMTITLTDSGDLGVANAPENLMLAFGLLELAKHAITEQHRKAGERLIQPAVGPIPNLRGDS